MKKLILIRRQALRAELQTWFDPDHPSVARFISGEPAPPASESRLTENAERS